jgi:hypothetical protein
MILTSDRVDMERLVGPSGREVAVVTVRHAFLGNVTGQNVQPAQ